MATYFNEVHIEGSDARDGQEYANQGTIKGFIYALWGRKLSTTLCGLLGDEWMHIKIVIYATSAVYMWHVGISL